MKKYFSAVLAICLIICCAIPAFAADVPEFEVPETLALPANDGDASASPNGWGGTPPQVTAIESVDDQDNTSQFGPFQNGDGSITLRLKVTGQGKDINRAYLDQKKITSKADGYFKYYGTTADGFYYRYNFGVLGAGSHTFQTTFRSTASPYSKMRYVCSFTLTAAGQLIVQSENTYPVS